MVAPPREVWERGGGRGTFSYGVQFAGFGSQGLTWALLSPRDAPGAHRGSPVAPEAPGDAQGLLRLTETASRTGVLVGLPEVHLGLIRRHRGASERTRSHGTQIGPCGLGWK